MAQAVASNGVASSLSVVHQDIGLLQRGREVRALGANIVVADVFDSGMWHLLYTFHPSLYISAKARRKARRWP